MELIASWTMNQDASMEEPCSVKWGDGTVATLDDFRAHQLDTHTFRFDGSNHLERHMFPGIVADVTFDANVHDWVMSGQDVNPAALGLNDPAATDEAILAEIFTFPTVYRHRITRP
jgi:hypothetical protein